MTVQRYEWEDALIEAQVQGTISNGALLLALKLAKAITWVPKGNKPSGLYWSNEEALKAVGAGRSTYFKHRSELFDGGFFIESKSNLLPTLPAESTVETADDAEKSTVETQESTVETEKSTGDNPFTVDTFTVDTYSVKQQAEPASKSYSSSRENQEVPTIHGPSSATVAIAPLVVKAASSAHICKACGEDQLATRPFRVREWMCGNPDCNVYGKVAA